MLSRFVVHRLLRFPGDRVPAMKVDGRKVQGSRAVSRELDALRPEPSLFPADPDRRAQVEEAERWGDEYFQEIPRKISWWALKRRKADQASFLVGYRLGLPTRVLVATSPPLIRMAMRLNNSTDEVVPGLIESETALPTRAVRRPPPRPLAVPANIDESSVPRQRLRRRH